VIPVETTPAIEGGGWRMIEKVNSCMIYLIHCKNLCKCHKVASTSTTIKETKRNIKK
jgi:hypothetical protein